MEHPAFLTGLPLLLHPPPHLLAHDPFTLELAPAVLTRIKIGENAAKLTPFHAEGDGRDERIGWEGHEAAEAEKHAHGSDVDEMGMPRRAAHEGGYDGHLDGPCWTTGTVDGMADDIVRYLRNCIQFVSNKDDIKKRR
jgi:hypothetical protein